MRKMLFLLLLFACNPSDPIPSLPVNLSEDLVTPRTYAIPTASGPITIDGIAKEDSWQQTQFTQPFIDIEGVKQPRFTAQVKMLWDTSFLYIYAELEEPHIWGNLRQRDTVIFYNNDFEVFIDPSGDTYNYGEIEINALGTVWDLLLDKPYRVGGKANNHWNLDELKTAIYIKGSLNDPTDLDSFWSLEMAIPMAPLAELKDPPKSIPSEGEIWRMNFSRVNWDYELVQGRYDRKKENGKYLPEYNWVWSNQKVINMHEPEKWGYVQFTNNKTQPFTLPEDVLIQQIAYALFRKTRFGSLKHLNELSVGSKRTITAQYAPDKNLPVTFFKTHFGFEYQLSMPGTNQTYFINEEGRLKKR